ncbi:hypothetical protein MKW98_003882 [Papaver atlanticum]|uniref:RING-type domain-containing protein n=1 Tax=Papaver atlanticum TaxID=357466 RepID=A0AAD4XHM1_9MAGN|nr:hypothetical protein MKW98_003882 [Papaver atlanticum]
MGFFPFVMAPFIAPNSKIPYSIQLITYILITILKGIFLKFKRILGYRCDVVEQAEVLVSFNPIGRNLMQDSYHDLYTADAVAELLRRVTTVSSFEDLIDNPCTTYHEEDSSCVVCLCQFQGKDEIRQLNTCRHIFHRQCLDRWIHYDQVLCPLCRTPLLAVKM